MPIVLESKGKKPGSCCWCSCSALNLGWGSAADASSSSAPLHPLCLLHATSTPPTPTPPHQLLPLQPWAPTHLARLHPHNSPCSPSPNLPLLQCQKAFSFIQPGTLSTAPAQPYRSSVGSIPLSKVNEERGRREGEAGWGESWRMGTQGCGRVGKREGGGMLPAPPRCLSPATSALPAPTPMPASYHCFPHYSGGGDKCKMILQ